MQYTIVYTHTHVGDVYMCVHISDLAGFLQSIRGCYELEEISTVGNPIEEEPKYR